MRRDRAVDYSRPHYVYRAFDGYGILLYVGCTLNPDGRLATHRSGSPWYRFAESIGVTGSYERREALHLERTAIDTEAPHFNSSFADMKRTQANIVAARKNLIGRGDLMPNYEGDLDALANGADDGQWDVYEALHDAWSRRHEAERARLKAGAFPYLTDADRLARYLAARREAGLTERAVA